MQCDQFEQHLQETLDARRSPWADPALIGHAERCAQCRAVLRAHDALQRGLEHSTPGPLAADFTSRVVQLACEPESSPVRLERSPRFRVAMVAAAAALLLVAILPAWQFWRWNGSPVPSLIGSARSTPTTMTRPGQQKPTPEPAPYGVANTNPERFGILLNRLVDDQPSNEDRPSTTVRQMAGGVRTLTSTITGALARLRESLPETDMNQPDDPQTRWWSCRAWPLFS